MAFNRTMLRAGKCSKTSSLCPPLFPCILSYEKVTEAQPDFTLGWQAHASLSAPGYVVHMQACLQDTCCTPSEDVVARTIVK